MNTINKAALTTIQGALEASAARLAAVTGTPELDAQVVLAQALGRPRTWVLAHGREPVSAAQAAALDAMLARLESREPLPYVLGHWEFFGLDFDLTPEVLIPRPETELLVESAIAWLRAHSRRRNMADIGTGSACIAVSIASQIPDVQILATDISASALQVARRNARKFEYDDRIDFVECDLLPSEPSVTLDLICANLPYIPTAELRALPVFGHEPTLALDGGRDGLDPFRRLFQIAPDWLASDGQLLLEVEAQRGMQVLSLAYDSFAHADIHLHQDLAGMDRLLEIHLSNT